MSRYHLDAYGALEGVRASLSSFFDSSFQLADPNLDRALHDTIARFGLLAPPVVEATFPYKEASGTPRTVEELGVSGILHPDLWRILDSAGGEARWPRDRPLYKHQVDAFAAYHAGRSLVVSSGTGSGKTECFLLPAIDAVLRDENIAQPGVRVLIVYPLNALVNNQLERLRALLGHHPDIRFGLYTRRLPNTRREAEQRATKSGRPLFPAEVHSREELRAKPPHILITNYSMLEYALVRTADAPLFASTFAKPRLVVLDEAHVYAGAMAAEITLLLRRAWLRWSIESSPQGIVTSATMKQGIADGDAKLVAFASDLLSKLRKELTLVVGEREVPAEIGSEVDAPLPSAEVVSNLRTDFPTLRDIPGDDGPKIVLEDSDEAVRAASAIAKALHPGTQVPLEASKPAAAVLWEALHSLTWVRDLRRRLHSGVMRVDRAAELLFPSAAPELAQRAVVRLLEILAVARVAASEVPLLPVRLHGTVRGPHGIYACIRPTCDEASVPGRVGRLYADPTERCSCGAFVAELRACQACGQAFFAMAEDVGDDGFPALRAQSRSVVDLFVADTGTWDDGSTAEGGTPKSFLPDGRLGGGPRHVQLRRYPGGVASGPTNRLLEVACPKCGVVPTPDRPVVRRIESGTTAVLQVLVDGLYPSLPEHAGGAKLRGSGRRALLFADNRQVAASLAAQIEESHDVITARRLLLQVLRATMATAALPPAVQKLQARLNAALASGDAATQDALMVEIRVAVASSGPRSIGYADFALAVADDAAVRQLSGSTTGISDAQVASFALARELGRRPSRLGNLEANGLVAIDYALDLRRPRDSDVDAAFPGAQWHDLVAVTLDTLRTAGVVRLPALPDGLRERLPSWLTGRWLEQHARSADGHDDEDDDNENDHRSRDKVMSLLPAPGRGNRRSAWLGRICAVPGNASSLQPGLVLREIWTALHDASGVAGSSLERFGGSGPERLRIVLERLRFSAAGRELHSCPRCKTHWFRHVAFVCPTAGCDGVLVRVVSPPRRDRLVSLASMSGPLLGLRTHEHTAQIGVDDLEVFERKFKAGGINLLVCSTTMELGVDIGGLSATVLTNVPPSPANYLQRAGRAGRRAEGTSLVLTFARPRPYDQAAFENPDRPFLDKITPPQVRLDSRRIVQRHANAVLLAQFFTLARAFASSSNPMAAFGEVDAFADQPMDKVLSAQPRVLTALKEQLALDPRQATLADAFRVWVRDIAPNDTPTAAAVEKIVAGTGLEQEGVGQICGNAEHGMEGVLKRIREQLAFLRSQLVEELDKPVEVRDRERIKAVEIAVADLAKEKLLAYLAEQQFLPRYGFPINVCRLHETWERGDDNESSAAETEDDRHLTLRLERDITVALSEYAPGAEVVAGKYVHASRGLVRHWTGADAAGVLPSDVLGVCGSCGRLQRGRNEGDIARSCPTCGEEGVRPLPVVRPTGFAVQWGTSPRRWIGGARPPARPVTESAYAARDDSAVQVSDKLSLAYDEEGEILVRSEGDLAASNLSGDPDDVRGTRAGRGYAICYVCGRAEPEVHAWKQRPVALPPALVDHVRLRGSKPCTPTNRYWRHVALAGVVRSETLRLVVAPIAALGAAHRGRTLATTLMVAMQLCAGEVLGIDSRELGGLLSPRNSHGGAVLDVVLYDARAGGSGHCRALLDRWGDLLDAVRQRLDCPNPRCTGACPKCLLAFETQRHGALLDRPALRSFLEDQWEGLTRSIVRDGVPVARLHRGGVELAEALSRAEGQTVTAVVTSIAPDSFEETGWLRKLVRSATSGSLRVIVGRLPNPNDDSYRFLSERLRVAIGGRELEMHMAKPDVLASLPWRLMIGMQSVFHLEGGEEQALGPHWLEGATIHRAAAEALPIKQRLEALLLSTTPVDEAALTPIAPPPSTVVHSVSKNLRGPNATFSRWFRDARGNSLFDRPLRSLTLTDPYLATKWQVGLLREVVELAKSAGCEAVSVITYPPRSNDYTALSPIEQADRISRILGNPTWKPLPVPHSSIDRIHKRVIKGERADGTKFEILLERGLDFIAESSSRGTTERVTRESYVVVRDPA